MPQIDFYILSSQSEKSRQLFACRITEKAYKMERSITIQAESNKDICDVDKLLWGFRDDSFVPHHIFTGENDDAIKSISVPNNKKQVNIDDILVNLSNSLTENHMEYQRIIEIVINNSEDKENARKRFVAYRKLGYEIKSHTI
jgi:DNA polymerase-3 subunit chi|tara:strand:+ start:1620 stop:2048 length:429 start_codon:yes stop_codon:yes gene_type:complete